MNARVFNGWKEKNGFVEDVIMSCQNDEAKGEKRLGLFEREQLERYMLDEAGRKCMHVIKG